MSCSVGTPPPSPPLMVFVFLFLYCTLICYRCGQPFEDSRHPTLYMRKYPDWAIDATEAKRRALSASDSIIRELLAHIAQYLPPMPTSHILSQYPATDFDCTLTDLSSKLCQRILKGSVETARKFFAQIADGVPKGRVLEGYAVFCQGIALNVKMASITKTRPTTTSEKPCETKIANVTAFLNDHTCSKSVETQQDTNTVSCKPSSPCHEKIQKMEKIIAYLKDKVQRLEQEKEEMIEKSQAVRNECKELTRKNIRLQHENNLSPVCVEKLKSDDLIALHTGLPSQRLFQFVFESVRPTAEHMKYWKGNSSSLDMETRGEPNSEHKQKRGPPRRLSKENELLLTLMKMKLNLTEDYLAFLFSVSVSLVSNILSSWIPLLAHELESFLYWPSREEVKLCFPKCFNKWPGLVAIVDCFEVATEKPSHIDANTKIFSSYKNRPTMKFLLACTPGGSISFISEAAGGNMSDKQIFMESGIVRKFSPGDKCMADKGFTIKGELMEIGVELILPAFVKGGKPLTPQENEHNKIITNSRIHVERVIGRLRDYAYLSSIIPITQLDLITPAAIVCCALTNLKPSVVPNKS